MSGPFGKRINLSKTGIRFDSKTCLVPGDCLELEIDVSHIPQFGYASLPLIVTGSVARTTQCITNCGTQHQIAIEFHGSHPQRYGGPDRMS